MAGLPWIGVEPGDIGFDGGIGWSGWIIRRATGAYGHVFIYHEKIDDNTWRTVEAGPTGVKFRIRTRPVNKIYRPWKNVLEQKAILRASESCVGRKYGWGEITRIALNLVGIKINGWRDNTDRMICSNHVAVCLVAMRRAIRPTLPYKPEHIWPQRLAEWADWYEWSRTRLAERREGKK